ncbi:MAG: P-II family nitrogen regulator [Clostridiaceae bacterium]|nr:P-II family nitrogen regulator [Clostridiaceae bacterium]
MIADITKDYAILTVVVHRDSAERVIRISKKCGVTGFTIHYASGFSSNPVLRALSLSDVSLEMVIMLAEKSIVLSAMRELDQAFKFHKLHHGYAFCIPVSSITGIKSCEGFCNATSKGDTIMKYRAIYTIVDRGNAENVIEAAKKAGAKGGTVIQGRGSGIHESEVLFSIAIEPEKEIILVLCPDKDASAIVESIRRDLDIDSPGRGIIFVQEVERAIGMSGLEETPLS